VTSRDACLDRMTERLAQWSERIVGLEMLAGAASPPLAPTAALRLQALRQRHADYAGQLSSAQAATDCELRHMRLGTERMADNFHRAYLETLSHFPR
jgi:hypothetical protein